MPFQVTILTTPTKLPYHLLDDKERFCYHRKQVIIYFMSKNKTVVIGESLAKKIAQILKVKYIPVINRTFPDGEVQPRLKSVITAPIVIVVIQDSI
jgi:hypothetical protein